MSTHDRTSNPLNPLRNRSISRLDTQQSITAEFGPGTQSVLDAVLQAVSVSTNSKPLDLPLVKEVVDPDALNSMFTEVGTSFLSVSFEYAEHLVTVNNHGLVHARPLPE